MVTLYTLLEEYDNRKKIPYERLLETFVWHNRRSAIIQRDREECSLCHYKKTEYKFGKHVWWMNGFLREQHTEKFLKKMAAYEQAQGDQFMGLSASQDDFEWIADYSGDTAIICDRPYYLHVHHKYYIEKDGCLVYPWKYQDDALTTLCNWCHFETHRTKKIKVYTEVNGQYQERKYTPCSRCHGAGYFPHYRHIIQGRCFKCGGNKYEELRWER
jgi:hypothetical protein